jgi:hypothetical protein
MYISHCSQRGLYKYNPFVDFDAETSIRIGMHPPWLGRQNVSTGTVLVRTHELYYIFGVSEKAYEIFQDWETYMDEHVVVDVPRILCQYSNLGVLLQ